MLYSEHATFRVGSLGWDVNRIGQIMEGKIKGLYSIIQIEKNVMNVEEKIKGTVQYNLDREESDEY